MKKSVTTDNTGAEQQNTTDQVVDLISQDPDFHKGLSKFIFPNGDSYEGNYCAHVSGLVWRQGQGTYTTKDGQIYKGEWDGDKLMENQEIQIDYADDLKYVGNLMKNKYSGPSTYQLEQDLSIICNFSDNKPAGDIVLIDPHAKVWLGVAKGDESLLMPEHAFYTAISKDQGKGKSRHRTPKSVDSAEGQITPPQIPVSTKYSDWRYLEKEIFAKTHKTASAMDFDSSPWYQDYLNFKNHYGKILIEAKQNGVKSLNKEERNWYNKYKEFEDRYLKIISNFKTKMRDINGPETELFELIHSGEYKEQNKPVPVIYVTESSDIFEEIGK